MLKTILTSVVVASLVTALWEYVKSKINFKQSKHLQIDNFYREISGKSLHGTLEDWSELLFFATDKKVEKKLASDDYLKKLIHRAYIYSSEETCRRVSNFQQYFYITDEEDRNSYEIMVMIAGVISSMKLDFTGESVSVKDTLRMKLTDYEDNKQNIEIAINEYNYK